MSKEEAQPVISSQFEELAVNLSESQILIVDDEPHNLGLLSKLLARRGFHNVVTCQQSRQVLGLVHQGEFDLLMLDLSMPELSGLEILDQLTPQLRSSLPLSVLVLSGDQRSHSRRAALALGAKDYVCKPFDPAEVLARIENLLELRQVHKRLLAREQVIHNLMSFIGENLKFPPQTTAIRNHWVNFAAQHLNLSSVQASNLLWQSTLFPIRMLEASHCCKLVPETLVDNLHKSTGLRLERIVEFAQILAEKITQGGLSERQAETKMRCMLARLERL